MSPSCHTLWTASARLLLALLAIGWWLAGPALAGTDPVRGPGVVVAATGPAVASSVAAPTGPSIEADGLEVSASEMGEPVADAMLVSDALLVHPAAGPAPRMRRAWCRTGVVALARPERPPRP